MPCGLLHRLEKFETASRAQVACQQESSERSIKRNARRVHPDALLPRCRRATTAELNRFIWIGEFLPSEVPRITSAALCRCRCPAKRRSFTIQSIKKAAAESVANPRHSGRSRAVPPRDIVGTDVASSLRLSARMDRPAHRCNGSAVANSNAITSEQGIGNEQC